MSPAREDPPDSRRYVRLWVGVIGVLLAVTLVQWWGSDDPAPEAYDDAGTGAAPTPTPGPGSDAGSDTEPDVGSPSGSATPDLPTDVDPSLGGAPVRCWSGDEAVDLTGCPRLTGEDALRYVFPRADDPLCEPVDLAADDPRVLALRCPVEVDGDTATVTYSEFAERDAMLDQYDAAFPDGPSGRSEDLVLFGPSPVGERSAYQGTAIYGPGGRWSVSFRGADEERTRRVLDTVEVRRWSALQASADPADLDSNDP